MLDSSLRVRINVWVGYIDVGKQFLNNWSVSIVSGLAVLRNAKFSPFSLSNLSDIVCAGFNRPKHNN